MFNKFAGREEGFALWRLEHMLTCGPATGLFRHADAGYDKAACIAHDRGAKIPR
jgi:urocanate hydratase